MRVLIHSAIGAMMAALALAAAPANASPVSGIWTMPQGETEIAISECGQTLCGRIVNASKIERNPDAVDKKNKNPGLRLRKLKGLLILSGFIGGPSRWKGGTIYNPSDGTTYNATIELIDQDTLKVTGCVVRPLCKSAKLTRSRSEGAASAPSPIQLAQAPR